MGGNGGAVDSSGGGGGGSSNSGSYEVVSQGYCGYFVVSFCYINGYAHCSISFST